MSFSEITSQESGPLLEFDEETHISILNPVHTRRLVTELQKLHEGVSFYSDKSDQCDDLYKLQSREIDSLNKIIRELKLNIADAEGKFLDEERRAENNYSLWAKSDSSYQSLNKEYDKEISKWRRKNTIAVYANADWITDFALGGGGLRYQRGRWNITAGAGIDSKRPVSIHWRLGATFDLIKLNF